MSTKTTKKQDKPVRVAHIRIKNILGIDELEFDAGTFTEVSGRNGQGKTSILSAIKSVVEGGHDATLLRKGAEEGEIVLELDNDMTVTKRVTADKSDTKVEREGMLSKSPAATIKALADLLSVNPIDFLRAKKKDRVDVLLESMPIPTDLEKLEEITGMDPHDAMGITEQTPALDAIAMLHKQIFDERTGVNRAAKEKAATVKQLTEALPDESLAADVDELDALRAQVQEIDAKRDQEFQRIADKLEGLRQINEAHIADLQRQIDQARAEFAAKERAAAAQKQNKTVEFSAQRAEITEKIRAAEAVQGQVARAAQARQTIAMMQGEVESLEAESKAKTGALEALAKYKSELLDKLPIKGLEVRDGDIFRDGVQFDRLNTAQQVQVAVEIAKLRAGKLGLICVDGIELLDSEAYQEFKYQAINSGLQLVVARVADHELAVKTS